MTFRASPYREDLLVEFFFRNDLWHLVVLLAQSARRNESSVVSSATSICAFCSDPE